MRYTSARGVLFCAFLTITLASTIICADPPTLAPSDDTYLKQGTPNQNQGTETFLGIQQSGSHRTLIRFSQSDIENTIGNGSLVSARLELYIETNGNNWGSIGRTMDVRRITQDWTESNATWNCGIDSNPSNSQPNCKTQWSGGMFEAEASDTINITNGLSGWVQFDVTADIAAFLSETSNLGWLLKKTDENESGSLKFVSKEGNSSQAPKLVLVFESATFDEIAPRIQIDSPSQPILINVAAPQIQISYLEEGSGINTSTLKVLIDSNDITAACSSSNSMAVCFSPVLTEGTHVISAQIMDQAGNLGSTSFNFEIMLGVGPHEVEILSSGDSYLKKGQPNQNQGNELILRVQQSGSNRIVVQFNQQEIQALVGDGMVISAFLQMSISKNGKNWGFSGRAVSVHRVTTAWHEDSVTWNCAIDSNITNSQPDCSPQWSGGSYLPTPTDSQTHTNSTSGLISYDVTADVLGFLSGTQNFGWLLRKDEENKSGLVEYVSSEGDPSLQPRLLLIVESGQANQPPVANNQSVTTLEDTPVGIVLTANDPDMDSLTFSIVTPATHGTLTGDPPNVTYEPSPDFSGFDSFTFKVNDGQSDSNIATVSISVTDSDAIPPDPSTVAPPLDQTVATSIAESTEFLYTGSNPIQTGVPEGTIDSKRVAVIRGKVSDKNGVALSGVQITISNHPEFGQTLSRADGMFDMVVNGGTLHTVNYKKNGFIPVQRQINTPWEDFVFVDDVVMLPYDENVTLINFADPMQIARASVVQDDDGLRQATMLFRQGTATMFFADATQQSLSNLNVRATEYSVGPDGEKAMPAQLPATSAYTYAVELSVDEAAAAGAMEVRFSVPVIFYLENFLNFPIGGIAPVGYYDRTKAVWIPSQNGRVIKIVSITSGLADLDIDGDGTADDQSELSTLGITDLERHSVATLYQPGQSLWRAMVNHFSPWDINWPYLLPPDARPPGQKKPRYDKKSDKPCKVGGSIIECQNQILGEAINITGTPFTLHYQSDRVGGRTASKEMTISISDSAALPSSLRRFDLEIQIAGKQFNTSFSPAANQTYSFNWDGRDAYGRTVQGQQNASVRIGYVYAATYAEPPASVTASFALASGVSIGGSTRGLITGWQTESVPLGVLESKAAGLGAWTLSAHHMYDPVAKILFLGNGTRRTAENLNDTIKNFAGFGSAGSNDGSAGVARFRNPDGIAFGPDGSLYVADTANHKIRRIDLNGNVTTVAGNGLTGLGGEGGLATNARLNLPQDVTVAPDGTFYISDSGSNRILRVTTNGILTKIAGGGSGYNGDGMQAIFASMNFPRGIALSPDGALYVADQNNQRLRRIGNDGIITTVAGTGSASSTGNGGPSSQAGLFQPEDVAFNSDGRLYIVQGNNQIRRITTDSIINVFAGNGVNNHAGDGGPATQASFLNPDEVVVAPDGSVYIVQVGRVRIVNDEGNVTTVAGGVSPSPTDGDNGPATQANLDFPKGTAVSPNGTLFISDTNNFRIRQLATPLPSTTGGDIVLASEDGSVLYVFNFKGTHLRTLDSLTGAVLLTFGYDSAGRLVSITDIDNNTTTIQHEGAGNPIGVVAPFGQQTTLTTDSNGYLTSITNPNGEALSFTYSAEGLLQSTTTPKIQTYNYDYDLMGKLILDEDPAGGSKSIVRTDLGFTGHSMSLTTELNRVTTYLTEELSSGSEHKVSTDPAGLQTDTLINTNGSRTINRPDGTVINIQQGADPRFGMQSPLITNMSISVPSGLISTISESSTVSLSNPDDPLSLTNLGFSVNINGKNHVSTYAPSTDTVTSTSPLGRQSITTLDAQGRLIQNEVTGVSPIQLEYDLEGRLSQVSQGSGNDLRLYSIGYSSEGYMSTIFDPLNRSISFIYDPAGRLIKEILPDLREINISYDSNGNIISVTPSGKPSHEFLYSNVDFVVDYNPPDFGQGSVNTIYTYNDDHQITGVTRPGGEVVALDYDSSGRLSEITTVQGTFDFSYDAQTGNLVSLSSANHSLSFTYDGFLPKSSTWGGLMAGSVSRQYNSNFSILSESVNGSASINFGYDNDDLLTSAGSMSLSRNAQNGLISSTSLGVVSDSRGYNTFSELNIYTASVNGLPVYAVTYTRDELGRISQKFETIQNQAETYDYVYDSVGHLTDVFRNSILSAHYDYDSNSNRLPGIYDEQDRLTEKGGITYSYTDNGELQTKTSNGETTVYDYDIFGNLITVILPDSTIIEYLVDGANRRIGKKVNGTLVKGFLYRSGTQVIAELDSSNNVVARFVYAMRINVPDYMIKAGVTYRIISDHLGSPRLVINTSTGAITQRIDYDEWGNVTADTNPGFQPFGFAGGLYDVETKLVRFGARDYDPFTGRWISKDPILFSGGDPNLYSYVMNDPINWVDPYGLYSMDEFIEDAANVSAGFGDTLTLGLTADIRDAFGGNEGLSRCSAAYKGGEYGAIVHSLLMGGAGVAKGALAMGGRSGSLLTRFGRGLGRFVTDSRKHSTVSRQYWQARGGAGGSSLHHWFMPQRAGGPNAGWNLLEIPRGLNSWMNGKGLGNIAEWGIRGLVPGSLIGGGLKGASWGTEKAACGCP